MPQTQPDRIDNLESFIERMDHKLDAIATDVQESKLESRLFQAQTTAKLESMSQRIESVEVNLTQKIDFTNERIDSLEKVTDQRFTSLEKMTDQRLTSLEKRMDSQDARIWSLIVTAGVALFGLLAKLTFFPDLKA